MVEWAGLESSLGSTGFDKMVDKDFETEKKGGLGRYRRVGRREGCSASHSGRTNNHGLANARDEASRIMLAPIRLAHGLENVL